MAGRGAGHDQIKPVAIRISFRRVGSIVPLPLARDRIGPRFSRGEHQVRQSLMQSGLMGAGHGGPSSVAYRGPPAVEVWRAIRFHPPLYRQSPPHASKHCANSLFELGPSILPKLRG